MTYLTECLYIFDITDLNSTTYTDLKLAFKKLILKVHPDKGGECSKNDFDFILSAYTYLYEVINRIHGGRNALHEVDAPEKIRSERGDEIINKLFEDLAIDDFNDKFTELNDIKAPDNGYAEWLADGNKKTNVLDEWLLQDKKIDFLLWLQQVHPEYISIPTTIDTTPNEINTIFNNTTFNKQFEDTITYKGNDTIILHPDQMATVSGTLIGYDLINEKPDNYTNFDATPKYTDVYSAYTSVNIISDKVKQSNLNNDIELLHKEYMKAREEIITPFTNSELEHIANYEKSKLEKETLYQDKVIRYFNSDTIYNNYITNTNNNKTDNENKDNFIITL